MEGRARLVKICYGKSQLMVGRLLYSNPQKENSTRDFTKKRKGLYCTMNNANLVMQFIADGQLTKILSYDEYFLQTNATL